MKSKSSYSSCLGYSIHFHLTGIFNKLSEYHRVILSWWQTKRKLLVESICGSSKCSLFITVKPLEAESHKANLLISLFPKISDLCQRNNRGKLGIISPKPLKHSIKCHHDSELLGKNAKSFQVRPWQKEDSGTPARIQGPLILSSRDVPYLWHLQFVHEPHGHLTCLLLFQLSHIFQSFIPFSFLCLVS